MHLWTFIFWGWSLLGAFPTSVPGLTLSIQEVEANPGTTVCLDIAATDFNELLAMQYSLNWDPAVLSFRGVQAYDLPGLGEQNFGTHRKSEGLLTFVWLDNRLQGVSLPAGHVIHQLCFEVKGSSGTQSTVRFAQHPTPIEVVNLAEEVIDFNGIEGKVLVR